LPSSAPLQIALIFWCYINWYLLTHLLYIAASRLISFRTEQFGTIGLVQDAHVNMPYQSWELRPRGAANHAQLTVTAAVVELQIQIKVHV